MSKRIIKRCSVCGDTCLTNVRLVWERDSDKKRFDICCACSEIPGKVNAKSVDNYPTTYYNREHSAEFPPKNPFNLKRGKVAMSRL